MIDEGSLSLFSRRSWYVALPSASADDLPDDRGGGRIHTRRPLLTFDSSQDTDPVGNKAALGGLYEARGDSLRGGLSRIFA